MDAVEKVLTMFAIIVILAPVSYYAYSDYFADEEEKESAITVELGDTVTISYVGRLSDSRTYSSARVFSTSDIDIYADDEKYPKTSTFNEAEPKENYTFVVGSSDVIIGWERNIVGLEKGDRAQWIIEPEDAYDGRLDSLVFDINRTIEVPIFEELTPSEFNVLYPGITPVRSNYFTHYMGGWDIRIEEVNENTILIKNDVENGDKYTNIFGWQVEIIDYNTTTSIMKAQQNPAVADTFDGSIAVYTYPDIEDKLLIKQEDQVMSLQGPVDQPADFEGIVVGINADTITIDLNEEVCGRTLTFDIIVESIN